MRGTCFIVIYVSFYCMILERANAKTETTPNGGGGSTRPGCNRRPSCGAGPVDPHCLPGQYKADNCWRNVYYGCVNGLPVPFVCPQGLIVNPAGIADPTGETAICDWPWNVPSLPKAASAAGAVRCGCNPSCANPPTCPPPGPTTFAPESIPPAKSAKPEHVDAIAVTDPSCTGTVLFPHTCDCQFYWTCDGTGNAILSACGQGEYFRPNGVNGGACTSANGHLESTACVGCGGKAGCSSDLPALKPPVAVLIAPVPEKTRHPLVALFLAHNYPLPAYLQGYEKVQWATSELNNLS